MSFHETMERVVKGFEIAGVAILVIGSVLAFVRAAVILRRSASAAYQRLRQDVGRAILLGLEILIIADIVQTVTVEQTIQSAVTLGLIVLVRMFLSFALAIELAGILALASCLDGTHLGCRVSRAPGQTEAEEQGGSPN